MKTYMFYLMIFLTTFSSDLLAQYLGGVSRGEQYAKLEDKHLSNWLTTDGDFANATNWSDNELPSNSETIMIGSAVQVNGAYNISDLVISPVGSITITPNSNLTLSGRIDNQAGVSGIVIKASADGSVANGSLIFQNDPATPVPATVEMYTKASNVAGAYRYQYFGIPVRTMVANWLFGDSWVLQMHENRVPALWELLDNTSTLTSFNGYAITQPSSKVVSFQGNLENSSMNYTCAMLTKSAAGTGGHLIGNPYTASININPNNGTAICFGNGMDKTLFLYNTGSYSEWQSGAGSGPGSYLSVPQNHAGNDGLPATVPPMQAFIVHVTTADGTNTISIPYAAVVRNINDAKEMQRSAVAPKVCTRINVNGASGSGDCMWLFSQVGCSHGFDNGWDGVKIKGSPTAVQLFASEKSVDYQVSTVDDVNNTELGFKASNDTLYTLTFTHENVEMKYSSLYLIDLLKNITTDITQNGSQYAFSATNSSVAQTRFRIVMEPSTPDITTSGGKITTNNLTIYNSKNRVIVNNPTAVSGQLTLFDYNGICIKSVPFKAGEISTFHPDLPSGLYIAKATTEAEKVSKIIYLEE